MPRATAQASLGGSPRFFKKPGCKQVYGNNGERLSLGAPAEPQVVRITLMCSVPLSGSHTSPGRPRIWRGLAPSRGKA